MTHPMAVAVLTAVVVGVPLITLIWIVRKTNWHWPDVRTPPRDAAFWNPSDD